MSAHTPGFRVEEIYRAFDGGDRVAAVKMLRAETGCGLKEAMDVLNGRRIETLPSFEDVARRRRIERAAPDLYEAAQMLSSLEHEDGGRSFPTKEQCAFARAAIAKAEGRDGAE